MNIVVTVKQVVDPNLSADFISVDAATQKVVSTYGLPPVMNGYDANALEAALKLREAHGGKVTVICLGDGTSRNTLKRAHAMGADAVVLLSDAAWADLDSSGVGQVLAAAIRKIGEVDLVLCGRQASDTDAGQVLFWIAQALDMPAVCPVSKIESVEGHAMVLHRLLEEGVQRVQVELPALLGISSEINEPRSPSMKGTMIANRAMLPTWSSGDLEVPALEAKVKLCGFEIQTRTAHAKIIDGATPAQKGAALADYLHQEGLI